MRTKRLRNSFRIQESQTENGPTVLKLHNPPFPKNKEEIAPAIQTLLEETLLAMKTHLDAGRDKVSLEETIGFLELIHEMTLVE